MAKGGVMGVLKAAARTAKNVMKKLLKKGGKRKTSKVAGRRRRHR